ncbi:DUF4132 domain-containing protein [Streptomyces sp. NPDC051180]|uniref:DUF4132 domain-containing protein n=1 Tax=Streptomyces sp. NPDC051180 TaxID=3155797 RepID=UPI00344E2A4F
MVGMDAVGMDAVGIGAVRITGPHDGPDEAPARAPGGTAAGTAGAPGEFTESPDAEERRAAALALHRRVCRRTDEEAARPVLAALARQELGWSVEEANLLLARLLGSAAEVAPHELRDSFRTLVPIALAAADQAGDFDRPRMRALRAMAESLRVDRQDAFSLLRDRMDDLLRREVRFAPGLLPRHVLDGLDDFGPAMRSAHAELLAGAGVAEFLVHCALMDRARATRTWRRQAAVLLARAEAGAEVVRRLLEGIAAQPAHRVDDPDPYRAGIPTLADPANTSLVRGVLWAALDVDADWTVPLVGAVALHAGTGVGGSGGLCRSLPLATTAVAVLGECGGARGEEAAQWLGRLPKHVRNRTVAKGVAKALEAVAARSGVTPSMLRERGVATLGLDGRGVREVPLGTFTAELAVRAPGTVVLVFRGPEGRVLKTAPRTVREEYPAELRTVRAGVRELTSLVAAERVRLEEHLAAGTVWPAEDWHRFYVDHPVTGALARALLWEVAEEDGADGRETARGPAAEAGAERWTAGLPERTGGGWALAGADGTARPVGPGDRLRLWHPLRSDGEEVAEWRDALADREEHRPFRQVFREVYPATAAESGGGPHSDRFAGRVLRYGQARALMAERRWAGNHLGYFSDGGSSEMVRELPPPGHLPAGEGTRWRARLRLDLVDEGASHDGVARFCSTGRVGFESRPASAGARGAWTEAALTDVPALVLSEAFRDVDLFVAVASAPTGADRD